MSRRKLYQGPRCGVAGCKSTRYYRADGQLYCQHNHLSAGFQEYEIDEEEAMASGFGQRRKRGPEEIHRTEQGGRIYYGKVGYAAFLQAFQLVMRQQAKFIENKLNISGFETLLKDLWKMFLEAQDIGDKLPDLNMTEDETDQHSEESDDDDRLLLEPISDDDLVSNSREPLGYVNSRYSMNRPILIHSIALCYLCLIMLRIPITIHDFRTWIISSEFPYMRAIRHVPPELLSHLAPGYYEALEPQIRPRASRIWKWTQQTALFLTLHCKIEFPPLNYRPLLFTMVKELLLPLDTFNFVVKSIDEDLPLNMYICSEGKAPMGSIPPETRVLCVLLVGAKLFYSLDEVPRQCETNTEPASRTPNLKAWRRVIQVLLSKLQGVDIAAKTEPADVLNMKDASIDTYLDWYTKTWMSGSSVPSARATTSTPQGILDMFPVSKPNDESNSEMPEASTEDRLKTVQWLYSHPSEPQRRSNLRPGQEYTVTSLEKPSQGTAFDDLLELAATMSSTTNHELRKHVAWLERYMAKKSTSDQTQIDRQRRKIARERSRVKIARIEGRPESPKDDGGVSDLDSDYVVSAIEADDYLSLSE